MFRVWNVSLFNPISEISNKQWKQYTYRHTAHSITIRTANRFLVHVNNVVVTFSFPLTWNKCQIFHWKSLTEWDWRRECLISKNCRNRKRDFTIEHIYRQAAELLIAIHSLVNICRFRIRKMPKITSKTTTTISLQALSILHVEIPECYVRFLTRQKKTTRKKLIIIWAM